MSQQLVGSSSDGRIMEREQGVDMVVPVRHRGKGRYVSETEKGESVRDGVMGDGRGR